MPKRMLFYLILTALILCTSESIAQNEQWLQYHSARDVSLVGFITNTKSLEIIEENPADVKLPEFKGKNPLFAEWQTPMVESGFLWIALDKTKENGIHDNLYIDSNADGNLDDETAITPYRITQSNVYFGPVKVVFEIEDGPVSYHLNFRFYSSNNNNRRLYVSAGGWYQGEVTINGQKKQCVLFDYNINGAFNDKAISAQDSDRIRISETNDPRDTRFVGNYIEIAGSLYQPEIAQDGACIKLEEAKDVKHGSIRLHESVTELSAGGINGSFIIKPEKGLASLPVGKYQINDWIIERKDDKDTQWKLTGIHGGSSLKGAFDISEDKETELTVGEPVVANIDAQYRDGSYYFNQNLRGRDDESITLLRNGSRPQAPKLNIKSEDGKYDRTYSFSYG